MPQASFVGLSFCSKPAVHKQKKACVTRTAHTRCLAEPKLYQVTVVFDEAALLCALVRPSNYPFASGRTRTGEDGVRCPERHHAREERST